MPRLIRLRDGAFDWAEDGFVTVGDEDPIPAGDVIVSLKRFMAEGEGLLAGRKVGVRLAPEEAVEDLAYDLPSLAVVALQFVAFPEGRPFSAAALLRQRYGFTGEIRAVGEVSREKALHMVRTGFDAFEPSDGADPQSWAAAAVGRYRHVYQRSIDRRAPAFVERGTGQ